MNSAEEVTNSLLLDENNTRDLASVMETNLIGTCLCAREAVKLMKKKNVKGHIININSIFGHKINVSVPGKVQLFNISKLVYYIISYQYLW